MPMPTNRSLTDGIRQIVIDTKIFLQKCSPLQSLKMTKHHHKTNMKIEINFEDTNRMLQFKKWKNRKVKYQSEFQYLNLSINLHSALSLLHLV